MLATPDPGGGSGSNRNDRVSSSTWIGDDGSATQVHRDERAEGVLSDALGRKIRGQTIWTRRVICPLLSQ